MNWQFFFNFRGSKLMSIFINKELSKISSKRSFSCRLNNKQWNWVHTSVTHLNVTKTQVEDIMNSKFILIFAAAIINTSQCLNDTKEVDHKKDFDFLVFAQVWPISGCLEWEDRSDKNTCYLPSKSKFFILSEIQQKNNLINLVRISVI